MNRSRKARNAPPTASAQPSRLASPQPKAPPSASTRTNSHRGGAKKVSIRAIFIAGRASLTGEPGFVEIASGSVMLVMFAELLDGNDQAYARRREHVPPVGNQLLIRL